MWKKTALGWALAGMAFAFSTSGVKAEFVEFEFSCVVETVIDQNSPQELRDLVGYPVLGTMNWADTGTVRFSYDTDDGAPNPAQPNLGFYYDVASLELQFPTMTLTTIDTLVSVQNDLTYWSGDPTLYDAIEIEGYIPGSQAVLPAGTTTPVNIGIAIRLLSTDLTTFSDGYMPATLNLADFDTRQFSVIADNFVVGDLDSLTYEWLASGAVVPEPSTSCLFLCGLAGIAMIAVRKRKRTPC